MEADMTDKRANEGNDQTVAVIGTGTMGLAMAANLCRAGLTTIVWDRKPSAAASLAVFGASVASTPSEAVRSADVVITMLTDANAVTSVAVDQGMLAALPPGAVWAQMGTIGVDATDRLAALVAERRPDVAFVDAPVSGSKGPAERGELFVLASGPPDVIDALGPVFAAVGQRTISMGEAGRGTRLKLVLNSWLAFLMEGIAETAALADALGITTDELVRALAGGPLAAPAVIAKLTKIDADDYTPEFSLALALKDVDLALASTLRRLPGMSAISAQWHGAVGQGLGGLDVSAAALALDSTALAARA
jgi:3-hydroxyisobutyrate dehydrogenase